ncbi:MAG: RNA-directed DNA polymerase [Alphaproteobacteria bacterium]|nr:RNA-directed DNA polymerase [Alphaproteobacteria bacterium]
MARQDAKQNFMDCPLYTDVFSIAFEQNIAELAKRLATQSYRPQPLTLIDIPKSTLAVRPGSVPEIEDRVVLQALVRLMAPIADKELPDAVYSYRIKKNPTATSLFKESDVLDIPYLKSKTITRYLDPFDPWYAAWPEFDERSREAFQTGKYKFLVVTDIAAYFENIQLPLLRDVLLGVFKDDQIAINFIIQILEGWTTQTDQGRNLHRGIPQGTQISSFLGNIFLLPLDAALEEFCKTHEAIYFRYMDDIRLFTKEYAVARKGLLLIDQKVRSLHLNTQAAKSEILSGKEIDAKLIDSRLDAVNAIIDEIGAAKGPLTPAKKLSLKAKLNVIAKLKPKAAGATKLIGETKPLKGLNLRVFRRWLTAHHKLGDHYFVKFIVREAKRNPDHRLTRRLISVSKEKPGLQKYVAPLFEFIKSDLNIFPHQWAEILWYFRYLSKIPPYVISHCEEVVLNDNLHPYVRASAATLLSRGMLKVQFLNQCREKFRNSNNTNLQIALSALLMQSTGSYARSFLHTLVFHPNEKIRKAGKLYREVRFGHKEAKARTKFLFSSKNDWVLCDSMAMLFSMSQSDRPEILKVLIAALSVPSVSSPRMDLRLTLSLLSDRAKHNLAKL